MKKTFTGYVAKAERPPYTLLRILDGHDMCDTIDDYYKYRIGTPVYRTITIEWQDEEVK